MWVLVISLDADVARRRVLLDQLHSLGNVQAQVVPGVPGMLLPESACRALSDDVEWAARRGTIGCFLSHVSAWEYVARSHVTWAVILEDDADASRLLELSSTIVPPDADIIFINERMSPNISPDSVPPQYLSMVSCLLRLNELQSGGGGDGYILTPRGAQKLVETCHRDLFYGHVDGRLLRYATNESDLERLPPNSWIKNVVQSHHNHKRLPAMGILKAYCLSRPVIFHSVGSSSRELFDERILP